MDELSIAELQAQLTSGALTARQLTENYLARIEAIDRGGPALNSVKSTWTRWPSRRRWTPSGRRAPCAGRCTASPF